MPHAPAARLITEIWHPNISSVTGAICLDILKDQWAAAMTLRTVPINIQALLAAPEPDDPRDAVADRQYRDNFPTFSAKMLNIGSPYIPGRSTWIQG